MSVRFLKRLHIPGHSGHSSQKSLDSPKEDLTVLEDFEEYSEEEEADSGSDKCCECDAVIDGLSSDELEDAARTSYAYVKQPSSTNRLYYARQMARRYLESAANDQRKALEKLKKTLQFRREMDLDGLREALADPLSHYHNELENTLSPGHVYVQGYDRDGRSTYVFIPRRVQGHDPTWTIRGHIWTLERAIACSRAKDQTVNAVVDFNGFSAIRHSPPTSIGKDLMMTLRSHYVGHVNQIFLIDAPTAFLCLWACLKPFAGRCTRSKIHFVSSNRQKEKVLGRWYSPDQGAPWMMPSGKKNRELDVKEYLHSLPFDKAFDE